MAELTWRTYGGARRSTRAWRVRTSAVLVAVVVLAVLVVPLLAHLDEQAVDLAAKLQPPSWAHPFGTDDVGRDLLLRCVYGLRVSSSSGSSPPSWRPSSARPWARSRAPSEAGRTGS